MFVEVIKHEKGIAIDILRNYRDLSTYYWWIGLQWDEIREVFEMNSVLPTQTHVDRNADQLVSFSPPSLY